MISGFLPEVLVHSFFRKDVPVISDSVLHAVT